MTREPAAVISVRGRPDDAELAAVLTVLFAQRRPTTQPPPAPSAWWRPPAVGEPGAWVAAAWFNRPG